MPIKKENYFFLKDGTVIKDLFELSKKLDSMPEEVFKHHVNDERNDFYNWIKDVVKRKRLAEAVKGIKEKNKMKSIVSENVQTDVLKKMSNNSSRSKKTDVKKEKRKKRAEKSSKSPKKIEKGSSEKEKSVSEAKDQDAKKEDFAGSEDRKIYARYTSGLVDFFFGVMIGVLMTLLITNLF